MEKEGGNYGKVRMRRNGWWDWNEKVTQSGNLVFTKGDLEHENCEEKCDVVFGTYNDVSYVGDSMGSRCAETGLRHDF
nr:hypothetical protein [uncultured Blautia sp.]